MSTVVLDGGPAWLFLLGRLAEIGAVAFFTVLWCMSMDRALKACDHSSRKMAPGQPWMIFIPLFGFIWQFVAVNKVSLSLATEYHFRSWKSDEGKPGIEAGLTACVVIIVVFLLRVLWRDMNPGLAFFTSIGICICMSLHRERLNAFTEILETEQKKTQAQFAVNLGPNPFAQVYVQPLPFSQPQVQHPANPFNPTSNSQTFQQTNQQPQGFPQYINPPVPPPVFSSHPNVAPHVQHQQYVQKNAELNAVYEQQKMAQLEKEKEAARPAGGWDGITTWEPPAGWKNPDLSDPREYFS